MAIDLKFNYGIGDIGNVNKVAGNIYIKKIADATNENKDNGRARLYIDTPVNNNVERLAIGGDVYVGDPTDSAAASYDVVINPNGQVINNVVTSADVGGYVIRVVEAENPDNYDINEDNPNYNVITFVVQK